MDSSFTLLVHKLIDTGWNLSINTDDLYTLIQKLIILSLKYVNKQKIWDILFPQDIVNHQNHVDWSVLKPEFNALTDLYYWMPLLETCSWIDMANVERAHPPLAHMKQALRTAKLDTPDHTLACQLLVLHLLQGIPVLKAFELLTCRYFQRNTHNASAILLAHLSDVFYAPDVYEAMFLDLFSRKHMEIQIQKFKDHLQMIEVQQSTIKQLAQQQRKVVCGRPRLRDLLESTIQDKTVMDTRLGTWESYVSFCQLHQFPNILNEFSKHKLYFLAAQSRWDWKEYVGIVLGHTGELSERITQYPVSRPDLHILHACIQRLNMNGKPPFQELVQFKNKCFVNFPLSQFQTMNLSHFLRLYVCVYQNETVWKDLWRMQGALFSPQIHKDCEGFRDRTPFAVQAFKVFFVG